MTIWYRHRGDTGDTIEPFLDGVVDLVSATAVSATVTGCEIASVTLSGSVLNAVTRQVRIELGSWITTAELDTYDVRIHVDFGPIRKTWPSGPNPDKLVVIV